MEFVFKHYKQPEFDSTFKVFADEQRVGAFMVTYNNDGDKTTAIVDDAIIAKLTETQVAELRAIK